MPGCRNTEVQRQSCSEITNVFLRSHRVETCRDNTIRSSGQLWKSPEVSQRSFHELYWNCWSASWVYSQTSVLDHLGSWTFWFLTKLFPEKMSWLCNKTWGLSSLPDNPFMLIPVWYISRVTDKGHKVFEQIASQTVFRNKSSRTEVPLYIPRDCPGWSSRVLELLELTFILKSKNLPFQWLIYWLDTGILLHFLCQRKRCHMVHSTAILKGGERSLQPKGFVNTRCPPFFNFEQNRALYLCLIKWISSHIWFDPTKKVLLSARINEQTENGKTDILLLLVGILHQSHH